MGTGKPDEILRHRHPLSGHSPRPHFRRTSPSHLQCPPTLTQVPDFPTRLPLAYLRALPLFSFSRRPVATPPLSPPPFGEPPGDLGPPPRLRKKVNMTEKFPEVQGGGSLILAWQIKNKQVLVVGGGEVSVARPSGYRSVSRPFYRVPTYIPRPGAAPPD